MSRKPQGWLESQLRSGVLHRLAAQCVDQHELIARLGITEESFHSARKKIRQAGRPFPSFAELRQPQVDAPPISDWDEEPTNPSARAFDTSDVAKEDFADREAPIPTDHFESGRSTLVRNTDPNSSVVLTWHKTSVSKQQHLEAVRRALEELPKPWRGMSEPVEQTQPSSDRLLNVFMMGDPHLGLMTWGKETGTDHDLATGERDLVAAIDHLVGEAPPADIGIVCSLGDLVHVDSESNTTTRGTKQDADSRWFKMMLTTLRAKRHAIDEAKKKHRKVLGRIIRGNHDWHSSAMIAMGLAQYYENDPRVEIEVSPDPFSWFEFGKCLLGWTHTDECNKPDDLAAVMAVDQAEAWGRTIYRYMMGGHEHHTFAKETRGVLVEKFPTLAPKCSWAHRKGYRALQSMCVDTYDAEYGRIGRRTVGIRQLRAA